MSQYAATFSFSLLIYIFSCLLVNAQYLHFDKQITYQLKYNPDTADMRRQATETFELFINDSISFFESTNKNIFDSILQQQYKEGNTFGDYASASTYRSKFRFAIIKSIDAISFYEYEADFGPDLVRCDEPNRWDWNITNEEKTLHNLNCQLATVQYAGRRWEAWFCADIPIFDGPYKFGGLPGLIISLSSADKSWNFEVIDMDLNTAKKLVFNQYPARKVVQMHKADFFKEKRTMEKNRMLLHESKGRIKFKDAQSKLNMTNNYQKYLKKNSNKIELVP
ncbi:GLPGLI family protein [Sphingobacterium corticibacter]|uniref:GLPGLI family protein n=1 Tax=Sphingobacterium corticibacter TaxID=2171749 RepID=A0A2T8HNA2_9SPHI|nr:GLPGLI family protein [Sphingobacterium corticibacter]PVH26782.1 hypothetical protein DC487_04045 [Sphingobacterium corticibacter]